MHPLSSEFYFKWMHVASIVNIKHKKPLVKLKSHYTHDILELVFKDEVL